MTQPIHYAITGSVKERKLLALRSLERNFAHRGLSPSTQWNGHYIFGARMPQEESLIPITEHSSQLSTRIKREDFIKMYRIFTATAQAYGLKANLVPPFMTHGGYYFCLESLIEKQ